MAHLRSRRLRQPRLKRAMQRYLKAMRRAAFIRAAIAKIAEIRRDHPGEETHAALWLPQWVRQMALDGTEPPEPDMWSFYWRGKGQKHQGDPTAPASAVRDTPPSS